MVSMCCRFYCIVPENAQGKESCPSVPLFLLEVSPYLSVLHGDWNVLSIFLELLSVFCFKHVMVGHLEIDHEGILKPSGIFIFQHGLQTVGNHLETKGVRKNAL